MTRSKIVEPATPASSEIIPSTPASDIIPRTPANPTSPEMIPRTPVGCTGWSYTNVSIFTLKTLIYTYKKNL